jgi:glycosyltransferase involved in cell wall biosynthesis
MTRKRVLYTNFHTHEGGGHDTFLPRMAEYFSATCEVLVVCPPTSVLFRRCRERGLAVAPCDFLPKLHSLGRFWRSCRQFARVVRSFRPDLVHSNGGNDNTIVALVKTLTRPRFLLVRSHHALRAIHRDLYHYWLYNRAVDANHYASETAMRLAHAQGLRPRQSWPIALGIDTDAFAPRPRDPALAASLGIEPGEWVFGTSAGLSPYKRVDVMLEACAGLRDRYKFKVLALGAAWQKAELDGWVQKYGMADRFVYAGWHEDVRPYVALFDVGFLLSDRIETLSYASREMLAMGKPLLSSSFSGLAENVRDGVNGLLVPPGDAGATRAAAERFLTTPAGEKLGMAERARADAVARFSVRTQLARFAELYERLWGTRGSASRG